MKKNLLIYITVLLIISNMCFYFSMISFEKNKLNKYVQTKQIELENYLEVEVKEYVRGFFSGNNVFFTHDKSLFEADIHNINMLTKTRKIWTSKDLSKIIEGTNFDNIYFVDSEGFIKFTSNHDFIGKNIKYLFGDIAKKVMKKKLSKGEFINSEIIPLISNGELVLMSYYSPKYSSYMVFTEVNFVKYMKSHYIQEFESASLIRDVFNYGTAEYIEGIDLFYDNSKTWSMLNQGVLLDGLLTKEEKRTFNETGSFVKTDPVSENLFKANPENYKFTKLKKITITKEDYDFDVILKLSYNFNERVEYINNSLSRVLKLASVIIVISIILSSILFKFFVEKKLRVVIDVLTKIRKGEYSVKDINVRGNDELKEIAETINKLKKEVVIREKKLIKVAITDELTKLYNRKYLYHRLNEEQDKSDRYGANFSVVLIDIDHFKKINDTFGHQIGDEVLAELGKTLQEQLRKSDLAARYGGEEFMLVLPQTDLESAYQMIERLRENLATKEWETKGLNVTISAGIKEYKKKQELDPFIAQVDELLYKAKENGRNRTEI